MVERLRERHSGKRGQHCKGPEALKDLGRFQNCWNPLMSQPTAIHVDHIEVRVDCSLGRVVPLTFSPLDHSLSQPLLTHTAVHAVLEALCSLGLWDTDLWR